MKTLRNGEPSVTPDGDSATVDETPTSVAVSVNHMTVMKWSVNMITVHFNREIEGVYGIYENVGAYQRTLIHDNKITMATTLVYVEYDLKTKVVSLSLV